MNLDIVTTATHATNARQSNPTAKTVTKQTLIMAVKKQTMNAGGNEPKKGQELEKGQALTRKRRIIYTGDDDVALTCPTTQTRPS